jgi:hypothetical protein
MLEESENTRYKKIYKDSLSIVPDIKRGKM